MVCRAVAIPQQVSSLALVSVAGGPSVPAHLHPALRYFHGRFIIAPAAKMLLFCFTRILHTAVPWLSSHIISVAAQTRGGKVQIIKN